MEKYTLKEVADILNVSYEWTRQKTKTLPTKFVTKDGTKIYIEKNGVESLKLQKKYNKEDNVNTKIGAKFGNSNMENNSNFGSTDSRIDMLEKQLEEKDNQISELMKLLDQQQQLQAELQAEKQLLLESIEKPDLSEWSFIDRVRGKKK